MTRLSDFQVGDFTHAGETKTVYRHGSGPGVVIMHENAGINSRFLTFAHRIAEAGYTAILPHMFGTPGQSFTGAQARLALLRTCIGREFHVLAKGHSSPITDWLRALCRHAHTECGGPGVGAIGMCLTGNFALALMVDEAVMAPVLSQPSLPFGVTASHRRALHIGGPSLDTARKRARDGCPILGMRFSHDPLCPAERFASLRREFGNGFEGIEIDSSPGNPHGISPRAHSVLTRDLVDETGHPTREALDRVLAFLDEQLRG